MRVAWLTPYLPFPENTGGRIRVAQLSRALASQAELSLFSSLSSHDLRDDTHPPRFEPWQEIFTAPFVEATSPFGLKPLPARRMPPKLTSLLVDAHERRPFDAVVVEHCYAMAALPPALGKAAVVLDEHNIESDYFRGSARRLLPLWSWRRFERAAWRRADRVVTVCESDAEVVRRSAAGKGDCVSNGTAVDAFRFIRPSERKGSSILYVGMMDYPPNVQAARMLALEVLPLVRREVPDATLTLCGRSAKAAVQSLASESVRVTGTVPEVFSVFDEHAAYALPLRHGAGSSLKVLEPLAAGLPLVTSGFGVRGYEIPEDCYTVADDPQSFAQKLVGVLKGRADLDDMAERGRQAAQRYSWAGVGSKFAGIVSEAIERARQAHAA
jgi:glycosyltransferase involved in cell wall biosynthesis